MMPLPLLEALPSLPEKPLQDLPRIPETRQRPGRILNIGRGVNNQASLCSFENYPITLLDSKLSPKRGRNRSLTLLSDPRVIRRHVSYKRLRTT